MGGKGGGKGRAAPQCKFLDPLLQRLVCATALRRLLRTFLVNGNSVTPPSVADPEIQNPEWEFGYASISGGSRNSKSRMGIRLRLHHWWIQKFRIQNVSNARTLSQMHVMTRTRFIPEKGDLLTNFMSPLGGSAKEERGEVGTRRKRKGRASGLPIMKLLFCLHVHQMNICDVRYNNNNNNNILILMLKF